MLPSTLNVLIPFTGNSYILAYPHPVLKLLKYIILIIADFNESR
jgi:hypothetical protein